MPRIEQAPGQGIFFKNVDQPVRYTELAVPAEAFRVADMLDAPANPTNPRYDNTTLGVVGDRVVRVEHNNTLDMPLTTLNDANTHAENFLDARADEEDAKARKSAAIKGLIGIKQRYWPFSGVGFPSQNESATIVTVTKKEVPEENIVELENQAGDEFRRFATTELQLNIDLIGLIDAKGNPVSAKDLQDKLEAYLQKIVKRKGRFTRAINVHNWANLASLIRRGRISHDLVKVSQDYVVKPIPLSAIPKKKDLEVQQEVQSDLGLPLDTA